MVVRGLPARGMVLVNKFLLALDTLAVHVLKQALAHLDVADQGVTSVTCEILAYDHAEHLEVLRVGGHGIGGYYPAADAQLVGNGEFVVVSLFFTFFHVWEAECDEWETLAVLLGHDDEAKGLEGVGEIVGCPC